MGNLITMSLNKTFTMRRFTVLIISLFIYSNLSAQDKLLVAEGTAPNLYISHIVEPKENYYSVGRMYNVSPKDLAPYNNLTFETGLSLGQTLKIPLGPNNFSQGEAYAISFVLVLLAVLCIVVVSLLRPKESSS